MDVTTASITFILTTIGFLWLIIDLFFLRKF